MKAFGMMTALLGALLLMVGWGWEISASTNPDFIGGEYIPSRDVINIGLLQSQLMIWQLGLALLMAGSSLLGVGTLIDKLIAAGVLLSEEATGPSSDDNNSVHATPVLPANRCDWCERSIALPAKPCSMLLDEHPEALSGEVRDPVCINELQERNVSTDQFNLSVNEVSQSSI